EISQDIEVMLCWFDQEKPIQLKGKYTIIHTTNEVRCLIKDVRYKLDINTLHRNQEDRTLHMNDIGRVVIRTTRPLFFDSYRTNRITGSLIMIDEATNNTVAAGMIIGLGSPDPLFTSHSSTLSRQQFSFHSVSFEPSFRFFSLIRPR